MKIPTGRVLLAVLAFGYVVSAAPELSRSNSLGDLPNEHFKQSAPLVEDDDRLFKDEVSETESLNEMSEQTEPLDEMTETNEGHSQEVTQQGSGKPVSHGDSVALQVLYSKLNYLGCAGGVCVKARCPKLYMEGADWNTCYGQVFEIYRRAGDGQVKVGEDIGLYYPREPGKWLGCGGKHCAKASCPGKHTCKSGFSSPNQWNRCWGEVFQIYVRGKNKGALIQPHDHIMLYFPKHRNWIGLVINQADHRRCPGTAPPPNHKYDECGGEVFELWVKP